jgi:hypothetical protein
MELRVELRKHEFAIHLDLTEDSRRSAELGGRTFAERDTAGKTGERTTSVMVSGGTTQHQ